MSIAGAYFIPRGYGFSSQYMNTIVNSEYIIQIVTTITIFLIVSLEISIKSLTKYRNFSLSDNTFNQSNKSYTLLIVLFYYTSMLILLIGTINLTSLGGSGDFSYPIMLGITIPFVYLIYQNKNINVNIHNAVILFIFTLKSYHSKREIFYVLLLIVIISITQKEKLPFTRNIINYLKLSHFIKYIPVVFIGFILIIYSSIARGYGNYTTETPVDIINHIPIYLKEDYIADALVANFEINTSYGNLFTSLDYYFSGKYKLLYGETFIKFLFLPVPRDLIGWKPESFINVYTYMYNPTYRSLGGSFPVVFISEFLWNFSYFAIFPFIILISLINRLFYIILKHLYSKTFLNSYKYIFGLYLIVTFLQFVRGSGIDLWLVYPTIALPFIIIYTNIFKRFN